MMCLLCCGRWVRTLVLSLFSLSWGAGSPVALGHLISGASRFVKSVHILEVCRTHNVCPFSGWGRGLPVARLAWPQLSAQSSAPCQGRESAGQIIVPYSIVFPVQTQPEAGGCLLVHFVTCTHRLSPVYSHRGRRPELPPTSCGL